MALGGGRRRVGKGGKGEGVGECGFVGVLRRVLEEWVW